MFRPLERIMGGGVAGEHDTPTSPSPHFFLHLPHKIRRAFPLRGKSHGEGWNMDKETQTRKDILPSLPSFLCHVVSAIERRMVRCKKVILGSKQQKIWKPDPQDLFGLLRIGSLPRTSVSLCQPGVPCGYRVWHTLGPGATACFLPSRSLPFL